MRDAFVFEGVLRCLLVLDRAAAMGCRTFGDELLFPSECASEDTQEVAEGFTVAKACIDLVRNLIAEERAVVGALQQAAALVLVSCGL